MRKTANGKIAPYRGVSFIPTIIQIMTNTELQSIYLSKISETLARLAASESFLASYTATKNVYEFEAAVLQIRKSLEALAFAAIAPNKAQYCQLRLKSDISADYRKDFNARKIMQFLAEVNPDFYPTPVTAPVRTASHHWHFERREDDSLKKKKFESFYDRLGKFLHADNPWGNDKGLRNLGNDIPGIIQAVRLLLSYHFTTIRTPEFSGVWVVEAPLNNTPPRVVEGQSTGDFVVH